MIDFENPQNMGLLSLGLGLLKSSGPSAVPTTLGSAFGEAGQGGILAMQNAQKLKMAQDLQRAQMEHMTMQNALLKAQSDREAQKQAALGSVSGILEKLYSGAGQQAMAQGAAEGDVGPTVTNEARMGGIMASPGMQNQVLDVFDRLSLAGVDPKSLIETYRLRNPEMKVEGGYAYNPRTVSPGFLPQVRVTNNGQAVGVTPSASGGLPSVSALPGAVPTYRGFQQAGEEVKAGLDPFMNEVDPQGRPIPQTRLGFSQRYGSPQRETAPDVPSAISAVSGAKGPMSVDVGPYNPSRKVPNGMGPTITQKSADEARGANDAKYAQALGEKIPSLNNSLRVLDRLEQLTGNDQTYAAAGAEIKTQLNSVAQSLGMPLNVAKTANTEEYIARFSELLKERLASKDYGSGSGISNLDLATAGRPLPELTKTAQGRMQIIQALKADAKRALGDATAARSYFEQNRNLSGFRFPSEIEAQVSTEKPKGPMRRKGDDPLGLFK